MAQFKSSSPADLKLLAGGMCPECGAALQAGVTACGVCKVTFAPQHAAMIGSALARPAAPPAGAPATSPLTLSMTPGKPLTAQEFDDLERGPLGRRFPLSAAPLPEVMDGAPVALGSALSAVLMHYADAALVDDVDVLLGKGAGPAPVMRALINVPSTAAALEADGPGPSVVSLVAAPPVAAPPPPAAAPPPPVAAPPAPPAHRPLPAPAAAAQTATQPAEPITAVDPDATIVHDANAIAGIIEGIAGTKKKGPVASGGARAIDD